MNTMVQVMKRVMLQSVIMGVLVHVLMLYSVFDIYFVSPIYNGMTPHKSKITPPAKRVVLFVADGLRATSLYGKDMKLRAPFLYSVMNTMGSWGISHTQVPTESRPGHIALLAGFNEDPSAITRGWQSNPVDFDSVINQSNNAWCWGSPDIVDMFNKYSLPHIHLYSYDSTLQDFSGKNNSTTALDIWVFEKVYEFLNAQKQSTCTNFCENGNILFLHLLGLDTAGHSFKPESKEHIENIKVVDEGIMNIAKNIDGYFKDNMTAYIFTADHGMTNWGSHGDGSKHETEVPFMAWGAGITQSIIRHDIEQINIATLLASLIGINIPINSLGIVPIDVIDANIIEKSHILYANARQLGEQYMKKHTILKENSLTWTFQPFSDLPIATLNYKLNLIDYQITLRNGKEAINAAYEIITLCKDGLKYYDSYYQNVLLFFVTVGFTGWIFYLFISINNLNLLPDDITYYRLTMDWKTTKLLKFVSVVIYVLLAVGCASVLAQSLPIKYYIYCIFCITWYAVLTNLETVFLFFSLLTKFHWLDYILLVIGYGIGIELLIISFFERQYISILLLYNLWKFYKDRKNYKDFYEWSVNLVTIIILTGCPIFLQLQSKFSYLSWVLSVILWLEFNHSTMKQILSVEDKLVLKLQFCFLYIAFLNVLCVNLTISNGYGLFVVNQFISWMLLVLSPITPLLMTTNLENRILSSMIALMVPYTLMGVGYEPLFMHFFARLVLNWSATKNLRKNSKTFSTYQDYALFEGTNRQTVEYCFFLLVLMMFGYFGVGNTASISSFDPMWVRCFVTIFSPFTMAGLIIIKLIIPFLIVLCGFRNVIVNFRGQLHKCFLILLLFCDLMVIQFLYFVKNDGSWLEIGVSLSRFIAVNVTTILLIILYQVATILTTVTCTKLKIFLLNVGDYVKLKFNG